MWANASYWAAYANGSLPTQPVVVVDFNGFNIIMALMIIQTFCLLYLALRSNRRRNK